METLLFILVTLIVVVFLTITTIIMVRKRRWNRHVDEALSPFRTKIK